MLRTIIARVKLNIEQCSPMGTMRKRICKDELKDEHLRSFVANIVI